MSKKLQAMLLGALLTMNLILAIALVTLVMSELNPVQADVATQSAPTVEEATYYQLTDAPQQRNISNQQFMPLQ
jgi:hypothetical protein